MWILKVRVRDITIYSLCSQDWCLTVHEPVPCWKMKYCSKLFWLHGCTSVKTREMSEAKFISGFWWGWCCCSEQASTPRWVSMQLRFSRCSNQDVTVSFRKVSFVEDHEFVLKSLNRVSLGKNSFQTFCSLKKLKWDPEIFKYDSHKMFYFSLWYYSVETQWPTKTPLHVKDEKNVLIL